MFTFWMQNAPQGASRRRRNTQPRFAPLALEAREMMAADADWWGWTSPTPVAKLSETRQHDGWGNNVANPHLGAAFTQLLRTTTNAYGNRVWTPSGADRPNPRVISNVIVAQNGSILNDRRLTDMIWQWGQFIDHDLDLTEAANPAQPFPVRVPTGDPFFDPHHTGRQVIGLNRSEFDPATGTSRYNPRQQINQLTAFMDGSMVYGVDDARVAAIRAFWGGRLKVGDGDLLPLNTEGLPNGGGTGADLFLAGETRANEQVGLTAMHTLFVREHNFWADRLRAQYGWWSDERLYQAARAIVVAEIQVITYHEFLPALLGEGALRPYTGYNPNTHPGIANEFSTAAFRLGHTLLSPYLARLNNDGSVAAEGPLALRDAFFNVNEIKNHGIDSLLKGLVTQNAQELDAFIVDDVRNFLFGPPGAGGFDLASLNIQRGRDHGLPGYNQMRADWGLARVTSFDQITSDADLAHGLRLVYGGVDKIDPWVGIIAEDHVGGGSLGELGRAILIDQFERVRDADRFWYTRVFSPSAARLLSQTTLGDIIERNTHLTNLQRNVFFDPSVVHFRALEHLGASVTLTIVNNWLTLRDNRSGKTLESRAADGVWRVILAGGDDRNDTFFMNVARGNALWGGIVAHGGAGGCDTLAVYGTSAKDYFTVDDGHLRLNQHDFWFSDLELLKLQVGAQDYVNIKRRGLTITNFAGQTQYSQNTGGAADAAVASLYR